MLMGVFKIPMHVINNQKRTSLITHKTVNSLLIRISSPSTCAAINCEKNDPETYCLSILRIYSPSQGRHQKLSHFEDLCCFFSRKRLHVDCLALCFKGLKDLTNSFIIIIVLKWVNHHTDKFQPQGNQQIQEQVQLWPKNRFHFLFNWIINFQ